MCTHLFRRGVMYYFRRRVPMDLVQSCGKSEIVQSLKTSNRAEAMTRLRKLDVDLDLKFAEARENNVNKNYDNDLNLEKHVDSSQPSISSLLLSEVPARQLLPSPQQEIQIVPAFKIKAKEEQANSIEQESQPSKKSTDIVTMQDLYDIWLHKEERGVKTKNQYQLLINRFGKERNVKDVTKTDCINFRDKLLNEYGLSISSVNLSLGMLGTFFNIGIDNEFISDNKMLRLTIKSKESAKSKRKPFDEDSLIKIFTSPLYVHGKYPKACGGKAGYWLPILALFTGARLEELAQLQHNDIRQETYYDYDGNTDMSDVKELKRWVLNITDEGGEQKVKTSYSIRRVPIHSVVIEQLGFLEYLKEVKEKEDVKNNNSGRVFPDLLPDVSGKISGNWCKWFSRYLRIICGIEDKKMVFHSFRHTFKDLCRTANVEESVHDALTGHSNGSVSRSYGGTQYPLRPLVKAIDSLIIPSRVIKILTHKNHN